MRQRDSKPRIVKKHFNRGALYLVLLIDTCVIPFALAQRTTAKANKPADVITVTKLNDSGPGTLRQALADANDGDTIDFGVTGTIGLTTGELLVAKSVTISGPGAKNLAVDGNAKSTVFHIAPSETVTISGLTIINGYTTGSGSGIHNDHATLTLNNCTITGNQGSGIYGAIYNDAENSDGAMLEINNSSVTNNSGGGIFNDALGGGVATLNITDSSLTNNSGGAIYSRGWLCTFCPHGTATVQITNSSITGNGKTPNGGAIYSDTGQPGPTTVSLTNSTVSGNAGAGMYISIEAAAVVSNSTISGNSEGGIYSELGAPTGGSTVVNSTMSDNYVEIWYGAAYIKNTIFNVSPGGHSIVSDGFNTIMSNGYNVSSDDGGGYLNGPGDQINTDPMLGPLQDNGGPTFTYALLPGSPAINAGDPNFVGPPDYDQRGPDYYRVRGGRIDVGSFEVQGTPGQILLRAKKKRIEGINTVRLQWRGAISADIDVYRNNVLIVTTPNDGRYDDSTGDTGRARYVYRVCEAGTQTCSNDVTVNFPH